jgi:hypothetical protein
VPYRLSHITCSICTRTTDGGKNAGSRLFGRIPKWYIICIACGNLLRGVLYSLSKIQLRLLARGVVILIGSLDTQGEEGTSVILRSQCANWDHRRITELQPGQFGWIGTFDIQSRDRGEFGKLMMSPSCIAGDSVHAGALEPTEYMVNKQRMVICGEKEELHLFPNKQYVIALV